MKIEIPSLGVLAIDFQYVRIEQKAFLGKVITERGAHTIEKTVGWKMKTICSLELGEAKYQTHVWSKAKHEQGFNKKEERKRALTLALRKLFPTYVDPSKTLSYGRDHRRFVWAALKRGLTGVYHQVSPKYLGRYVDEFTFRLNDGNVRCHTLTRLDAMIRASSGKRLTHERLTQ